MRLPVSRFSAGRGGEGVQSPPVLPGRAFSGGATLAAPLVAASVAAFLAAPWLDERLVWCEWVGVAAGLMFVKRLRGLRHEAWALAAATGALATAFHWAPGTLATAMQDSHASGLAAAAPIILWDAVRLVLPFWFACRLGASPIAAWLPAALVASFLDACWPAVFPWKFGYAQIGWPWLVQSADLFGPEFTTFMLFAHAGALVWLLALAGIVRTAGPLRLGGMAAILCLLNSAYGGMAAAWWEARIAKAPSVVATLVQADPAGPAGVEALRALTAERLAAPSPPDLVCWPECSGGEFDARLTSFADPAQVAAMCKPGTDGGLAGGPPGAPLLCGGIIYEGYPERPAALHQSALLVDAAGAIRGRYDKRHLMPFGEYVPLAGIWPDLRRRFPLVDTFSPGTEATVLAADGGLRIGVMLCYEDMVPEAARSLVRGGANLLVSLVNGTSFTAPLTLRQHRQLAQLRAVECRRSLLRCAATGETCVISPTGTIAAALPLHAHGTLDARVPLIDGLTLANRLGPTFPISCGLAAAAAVAIRGLRKRRHT
jgi:apolipoprotein N-acyltransferase